MSSVAIWHSPKKLMWRLASNTERDPSNHNISASAQCVCSDSWPAGGGRLLRNKLSSDLGFVGAACTRLVFSLSSKPAWTAVPLDIFIIIVVVVICGGDWSSSAAHTHSLMSDVVWIKATFLYKQPSPAAVWWRPLQVEGRSSSKETLQPVWPKLKFQPHKAAEGLQSQDSHTSTLESSRAVPYQWVVERADQLGEESIQCMSIYQSERIKSELFSTSQVRSGATARMKTAPFYSSLICYHWCVTRPWYRTSNMVPQRLFPMATWGTSQKIIFPHRQQHKNAFLTSDTMTECCWHNVIHNKTFLLWTLKWWPWSC